MDLRHKCIHLLCLLAFGTALAPALNAQVLYGSIVGNVSDPQGAILPGVTVAITNTGTGLKLDTVTDDTGNYVFRNLLPGSYDLTVSLQGFKEMRQTASASWQALRGAWIFGWSSARLPNWSRFRPRRWRFRPRRPTSPRS
jgi:hypothetical protein